MRKKWINPKFPNVVGFAFLRELGFAQSKPSVPMARGNAAQVTHGLAFILAVVSGACG